LEEGILDGLERRFSSGLNTAIGANGTGKTAVVELARFGAGIPSGFSAGVGLSDEHARAVLGSGQVAIAFEFKRGETAVSSYSVDEEQPSASSAFSEPIVFSHTEIETLGRSQLGSLSLIDHFVSGKSVSSEGEAALTPLVSSATAGIKHVRRQSFWAQRLRDLGQRQAHLVGYIMRRVACDAGGAFRTPFVLFYKPTGVSEVRFLYYRHRSIKQLPPNFLSKAGLQSNFFHPMPQKLKIASAQDRHEICKK
jgi:hypothetical protein